MKDANWLYTSISINAISEIFLNLTPPYTKPHHDASRNYPTNTYTWRTSLPNLCVFPPNGYHKKS